jgi:hypothetical protein
MGSNRYKDNRGSCGTTVMSSCVPYTGENDFKSFDLDNLPCNPNINDIIKELDSIIKILQDATSVADVKLECFDDCICSDLTIKELFELLIKNLCSVIDRVKTLEESYQNIGLSTFNVDLSCFNSPCFNNDNSSHTLLEIVTLLINEICQLKNKIQ